MRTSTRMLQHQGVCHLPPTRLSFPTSNVAAQHLHLSNQAGLALHSAWSQTSLPAPPGSPQYPFCTIYSYEKYPDLISYSYTATHSHQGRAGLHGPAWRRWYKTMCLSCAKLIIPVLNNVTVNTILLSCKSAEKGAINLNECGGGLTHAFLFKSQCSSAPSQLPQPLLPQPTEGGQVSRGNHPRHLMLQHRDETATHPQLFRAMQR